MNGYDKYLEFQYRQSGHFYTALFEAISKADEDNLELLSKGFPEEVDAFRLFSRTQDGVKGFLAHCSAAHPLKKVMQAEYGLENDDPRSDLEREADERDTDWGDQVIKLRSGD